MKNGHWHMKRLSTYSAKNRIVMLYAVGVIFLLTALVFGVLCGSTSLTVHDLAAVFTPGFAHSTAGRILLLVRLPRTAAAVLCGAALAVSGAVLQAVLANRLASPGIIGVNAGAGLGVTACTALGLYGGWVHSGFAFLGAFGTVCFVSFLSRKWRASRSTVILLGVAINSLLSAFSESIVTFIPEVGVLSHDFKIGDFSSVTTEKLIPSGVLIAFAVMILFLLSNELDVITLGEEQALSLGMNAVKMRTVFLILAALLAGCAVSVAGLLSFAGLMIPNLLRRLVCGRADRLLGLCLLYGGAFVCLCDTAARTLFAPYEIPVGIIMAFLGAPFFVFVLIKEKGVCV